MFQRLQKERECEEKKLEASKVTLKEQQQQLEKELMEQKGKLDQVLAKLLVAEERVRTLQEEGRWSETLEKTLSQTSTCSRTWRCGRGGHAGCLVKYIEETHSLAMAQRCAGRRCPVGSC